MVGLILVFALAALLVVACTHVERPPPATSQQFQQNIHDLGIAKQNEEYRQRVTPLVPTPFQRGP